jgi:hypothetical protein
MTYLPLHILSVFHSRIHARESLRSIPRSACCWERRPCMPPSLESVRAPRASAASVDCLGSPPTRRPLQLHWPPRNAPSAEAMLPCLSTRAALRMESALHRRPLRAAPRAQAASPQSGAAGHAALVGCRGPLPTRCLRLRPRTAPHAQAAPPPSAAAGCSPRATAPPRLHDASVMTPAVRIWIMHSQLHVPAGLRGILVSINSSAAKT